MKASKKIDIFLFSIVLISFFLSYQLSQRLKAKNFNIDQLALSKKLNEEYIDELQKNIFNNKRFLNFNINILLPNSDIELKEKSNTIILLISDQSCGDCIRKEIARTQNLSKQYSNHIEIFVLNDALEFVSNIISQQNTSVKITNLSITNKLLLASVPAYLIINNDGVIEHYMQFSENFPEFPRMFFDLIKNKYLFEI